MKKSDWESITVNLLLICGSPRKKSNSAILLDRALQGAQQQKNLEVQTFYFSGNQFREDLSGTERDGFAELIEKWRWADAVILAMPVYTAAGPGLAYSALDRLVEALRPEIANAGYQKVAGVIMQGSEAWGLVELGAQHAIELLACVHCLPVSRLAGRVPDQEPPPQPLLDNSFAVGNEVAEIARLIKLAHRNPLAASANLLILNAGVEDPGIGAEITKRVENRISGIAANAKVRVFDFAGKKIEGCHHCNSYCGKHLECTYKDDFQEFREKWLWADGIIWVISANRLGAPAIVRRAVDRLSEVGFSSVRHKHLTQGAPFAFAKYTKPEAAIAYGAACYGGQTQAQEFIISHSVLRGNLPVTGSDPQSLLGPADQLRSVSQLGCNLVFIEAVDAIADDVAELSRRVAFAKRAAYDVLPERYFPSRTIMGTADKEVFFNERNA